MNQVKPFLNGIIVELLLLFISSKMKFQEKNFISQGKQLYRNFINVSKMQMCSI